MLLQEWVKESTTAHAADVTLSLLYQSSEHGFDAAAFHSVCNDRGATVTLIKCSNGFVFGCYTDQL
jgi:hypothetical protein